MAWLFSKKLMDSANSRSSQEQGEEYSADTSLDGAPCALWSGMHTQRPSWLPVKTTDAYRLSRSGMTFKPLTDDHGEGVLMSFLEDFPVRTLAVQGKEQALTESEAVCGDTWRELSVKFDPDSSSWKTAQCLWEEDLPESSVTLPKWGMMRDGELWERTTPEYLTKGTESGLWLTPRATDGTKGSRTAEGAEKEWARGRNKDLGMVVAMWPTPRSCSAMAATITPENSWVENRFPNLETVVGQRMWPTPTAHNAKETNAPSESERNTPTLAAQAGGQLNPTWVEKLMGWPANWTDIENVCTNLMEGWDGDKWETGIPRVVVGAKYRAHRLKAIGNGQVPAAAALAWEILTETNQ